MRIVISTHFDLARPVMSIKLDSEKLSGLVDNFAGVFASYQASRKTGVEVYFTNYEELEYDGANDVAAKLDKENTIVIVVDTIKASDARGFPASIANVYRIDMTELKSKLSDRINFIDKPFEPTEDETWMYGKTHGLKTLYFGVPISGENYHATDNDALLSQIDKASEILIDVINILSTQKVT
jgi:hypothetical protein